MAFEHAKEYLARALPWPQAHEEPSFVNIHWTFTSDKADRAMWSGRAVQSVEQAAKAIEWALKLPETRDVYVCLSTQKEAQAKISKNGWKYHAPIRNQNNAVALKSLFLDIDFKGGEHGYSCQDEAVGALGRFLGDTKMPPPSFVVKSGGGLHVYWTMARALIPAEWKPLAFALAEATKKHGLKCDTQVTIDCARVLRVPDTLNRKSDPARPVQLIGAGKGYDYSVERLAQVLAPYITEQPELPPRPALLGTSDLAAGVSTHDSAPINLDSVAKECGFVRDAIARGGLDYTNPLWNLTTLISTFTEGGRADAHRMAKAHPGYTVESTDALFDRKEKDKDEKGLGWPACKTISGSGCKACQTCVHFSAQKTPLHLGSRQQQTAIPAQPNQLAVPQLTASLGDLPDGYTRLPSGVVARWVEDEDNPGSKIPLPVCDYMMDKPWLQDDLTHGLILHFDTSTERNKTKKVVLPCGCMNGPEMRSILQKQGIMVPAGPKGAANLGGFLVSWIKQLQNTRDAIVTSPFGWNITKATAQVEGFVYGGQLWTPTGPRVAGAPDKETANLYSPCGDLKKWMAASKLVTDQKRPGLDMILASAFAAPLVRFTGREGLVLSVFSTESGIGKTTASRTAMAVWGHPIRASQSLDDTPKLVVHKMGQLQSLPVYWDELKTEDDIKKVTKLLFQVAGGKEGARLTRNIEARAIGDWQTMMVLTSNESLLDYVNNHGTTTAAGILRMVEHTLEPVTDKSNAPGMIEPSDADMIMSRLNDNYGHAGLEYAKFLGENHDRVSLEVTDFGRELNKEITGEQEERYWRSLMTVILMGAKYANEIKLTDIDEAALKAHLVKVLAKMRDFKVNEHLGDVSKVVNVANIFGQYMGATRARHTLKTNKLLSGAGRPTPGTIKVLGDTSKLDSIYVHIGIDDKRVRIQNAHFREWLKEKGYTCTIVIEAFKKELGMRHVQGKLGSGTDYSSPAEYLWEIDLAGSPHIDFIGA
jgi:hypothetical protein